MGSKESIALEDELDLNADLDLDDELDGAGLDADDLDVSSETEHFNPVQNVYE